MVRMRVAQVAAPGAPLEVVEREVPDPGHGEVRIRVEACGVCHSDSFTKEGGFPGIRYPIVPGHEVAGRIDALGPGAEPWRAGQRVGVGWHGGHCGRCDRCRRGDFVTCREARIPGIAYDGGYADYMIAPTQALAPIPDELDAEAAAPLLCAGITTFNALRNSGARAGDLVAVLGIGGLGHLALQFASRMGFEVVAIARGKDKEELARTLGARRYLDSQADDVAAELAAPRRCSRHSGDGHQRQGDDGRDRRARRQWQAARRRRGGRADRGLAPPAHRSAGFDPGLALRRRRRLRGDPRRSARSARCGRWSRRFRWSRRRLPMTG